MAHKILLVEDDPCFGSVLKSYLELSDYEVTLCVNGNEGLEAFRKNKFDICLLDVMMPEMDGFTLGKKIREFDTSVPFVYITAKNLKEDVKQGYEIGADDYIVKPFDSEVLILKIKAILSRS
nr:response regulator [Odoribacter sp.]